MPSTNTFNEMCVKITLLKSIMRNLTGVCNAVYFRLCIDLMHILPPVTAEGFDGSHHPRCAEWGDDNTLISSAQWRKKWLLSFTFLPVFIKGRCIAYMLADDSCMNRTR